MSLNSHYRLVLAAAPLLLIAACASGKNADDDPLCSRAICGCWEDHVLRTRVTVLDNEGRPAPGLTLSCADGRPVFGTSDAAGSLRVVAAGRVSPGCGYIADCETAALKDRDGKVPQTFALTPLLRGEKVVAGPFALSATINGALKE